MSELRYFYSDEGTWLGSWRNVTISFWGPNPTVARIIKSRDNSREVLASYPSGLVSLSIIPQLGSSIPRLGAAERAAVSELVTELKAHTLGSANILEGSGFWVAAARAILTGIALLSPAPTKTFESLETAAVWLNERGWVPKGQPLAEIAQQARDDWKKRAQPA